MTQEHPITPPPELVQEWNQATVGTHFPPYGYSEYIATRAARWGADQELNACCKWLRCNWLSLPTETLRAARRPKLKSQVEEALDLLDRIEYNHMTKNLGNEKAWDIKELEAVRAALERLRELEKSND